MPAIPIHKDIFGNELALNDRIAFNPPSYKGLVKGKIVGFTPKGIRVEYYKASYDQNATTVVFEVVKNLKYVAPDASKINLDK